VVSWLINKGRCGLSETPKERRRTT